MGDEREKNGAIFRDESCLFSWRPEVAFFAACDLFLLLLLLLLFEVTLLLEVVA